MGTFSERYIQQGMERGEQLGVPPGEPTSWRHLCVHLRFPFYVKYGRRYLPAPPTFCTLVSNDYAHKARRHLLFVDNGAAAGRHGHGQNFKTKRLGYRAVEGACHGSWASVE